MKPENKFLVILFTVLIYGCSLLLTYGLAKDHGFVLGKLYVMQNYQVEEKYENK